jgi:hypothetical protein
MRKIEECTTCKFFNECRFSHSRNGADHCNFFIKVVADPQTFDYEQKLRDLLAIIHKDGGHYTEQHGIKKSFDDAKNEYYRLRVIEQTADPQAGRKTE